MGERRRLLNNRTSLFGASAFVDRALYEPCDQDPLRAQTHRDHAWQRTISPQVFVQDNPVGIAFPALPSNVRSHVISNLRSRLKRD